MSDLENEIMRALNSDAPIDITDNLDISTAAKRKYIIKNVDNLSRNDKICILESIHKSNPKLLHEVPNAVAIDLDIASPAIIEQIYTMVSYRIERRVGN